MYCVLQVPDRLLLMFTLSTRRDDVLSYMCTVYYNSPTDLRIIEHVECYVTLNHKLLSYVVIILLWYAGFYPEVTVLSSGMMCVIGI